MLNSKKTKLDTFEVKGVEFLHAGPCCRARSRRLGSVQCRCFPPGAAVGFLEYPC